jgi:hypothetical protein
VPLADVRVTVPGKGDHHRLPEQPLPFCVVPVPSAASLAKGQEQLSLRAELHHRGARRGGDPDVVLGIDSHAVRLVLIADDIRADLQNQFVIRIELEQLWLPRVRALKDPEVPP